MSKSEFHWYRLAKIIYLLTSNIKPPLAECERLQYESVRSENKPADLQYLWWMTETNKIKRPGNVTLESKNTIIFNKVTVIINRANGFYMTTNGFP